MSIVLAVKIVNLVLPQVENNKNNKRYSACVHCNLTLQCSLKCLFFIRGWLNFTDYAHYAFRYQLCFQLPIMLKIMPA